jgi:hypothetical protein
MKTIRHITTLFYYDGPQVFEARDAIGGHYVAVMVEPQNGLDRFLVAGVEPERLRQFRSGLLDLRTLLTERAVEDWFLTVATGGLTEPLPLQAGQGSLAGSGLLPEPGFLLHDCPAEEMALREARERNSVSNLGSQAVNLLGALEEADVTKRTWRIATPDDKYSGEVKQGGPSLEGLKLGGVYKFSCIEEIEEVEGTGREQRTLYLIEHRPA